jgi:3-hydroxyisobutyrate dehydrogenase-like beta-hydroxyacid dehydrogenase
MARRIVEDGFPTTLWARRPESTAPFADTAATVAPDLFSLGAASDVLGVCVLADADVEAVLAGPTGALAGMAPGGVVVIHSTVHPDTCRRIQAVHPHLSVLDAPVSGGGHMAAARALLVMVGGDADVLARCRPVLEAFADPLVHLGPLGAGQAAKLLNNALFTAHLGIAADLFAQGAGLGLDLGALGTVIAAASGRSYAAEVVAGAGHDLTVMAELAGHLLAKDVAIAHQLLADGGRLLDAADATLADMALAPPGPA